MLDRGKPELIERDTFRAMAYDPSRVPPPPVPASDPFASNVAWHWKIPVASFLLVAALISLEPADMVAPAAPLVIDVIGQIFAWGMLAAMFSFFLPQPRVALGGLIAGACGLALWSWCGLGGHAPMTAAWNVASGVATVAYMALNARLLFRSKRR